MFPILSPMVGTSTTRRFQKGATVAFFCALLGLATIPSALHAMTVSDEPGREEAVATNNPEILSKSKDIIARENSTITLECDVKDQGEYVLLWKFTSVKTKKIQVLYADKIPIQAAKYPAIALSNATNSKGITIKHLTANLEGTYICEISTNTPKLIQYKVSMMTAPVILPTPSNGKTTVRKNDHLNLACNVSPSPSPATIEWTHNEKVIEDNSTTLEIAGVQSGHEGTYICNAQNEIGVSRFTFNVAVEYEPEIFISEKIIHGPIGDDVEVKCEVKANPRAEITWQFSNNSRVFNSKKHRIENHDKYSILRIRNVDLKDYDNYNCNAHNSIGTQTVFFEVTGRPSKPKFISSPVGNDGDSYLIEWTLFSQNPILSYDLRIREVDHSSGRRGDWRHYSVQPNNVGNGPVRRQSYRLDNLSQFNGYEVDLEVTNSLGKTRSDVFHFVATDANSSPSRASFSLVFFSASLLLVASLFH